MTSEFLPRQDGRLSAGSMRAGLAQRFHPGGKVGKLTQNKTSGG
jgi:hypothetical protein